MHLSYWQIAGVACVRGSLVSFAGLLSAFLCTAVQIHAKLIMELNRTHPKCSFPAQVGRGSNAQSLLGIALVPACGGRRELLCINFSCKLTCKSIGMSVFVICTFPCPWHHPGDVCNEIFATHNAFSLTSKWKTSSECKKSNWVLK